MSTRAAVRTKWSTQPGSQRLFETCGADIALYVGQPGSGKSVAGLLDMVKWTQHAVTKSYPSYRPDLFTGAAFRRNHKQLMQGGGLWTRLRQITNGDPTVSERARTPIPKITWEGGATIELHHAQYEDNKETHDGAEYAVEFFDELPHFDAGFFWYLALLRNRTTCGIRPYTRASAMATPDCFVHELVKPWLLPGGWPNYEQSGRTRWFIRGERDLIEFFDNPRHALEHARMLAKGDPTLKHLRPKSLAVIHARTEENAELMAANPDYLSAIALNDKVIRMRMQGCWEARPRSAGMFDRQWYGILDEPPHRSEIVASARGWDKASTLPGEDEATDDPDWTRGVRLDLLKTGVIVVSDIVSIRENPGPVMDLIKKTARVDGPTVEQAFWRGPSDTGDSDEYFMREELNKVRGCGPVSFERCINKVTAAEPVSAYADKSRDSRTPGFAVVRAGWNGPYFAEVERFPLPKMPDGTDSKDDQVDAQSRAWKAIEHRIPRRNLPNSWKEALKRM